MSIATSEVLVLFKSVRSIKLPSVCHGSVRRVAHARTLWCGLLVLLVQFHRAGALLRTRTANFHKPEACVMSAHGGSGASLPVPASDSEEFDRDNDVLVGMCVIS